MSSLPLCQIAMSVTDLPRTHAWYTGVFGFVPCAGTNAFKGYLAEKVQGVPGARSSCWWLGDGQDFFQLELFQFEQPRTRLLAHDWRPCDIARRSADRCLLEPFRQQFSFRRSAHDRQQQLHHRHSQLAAFLHGCPDDQQPADQAGRPSQLSCQIFTWNQVDERRHLRLFRPSNVLRVTSSVVTRCFLASSILQDRVV